MSRGSKRAARVSAAGSHALARKTLARRERIGPAGPSRGTANYYLIARITEYNTTAAVVKGGRDDAQYKWALTGYKFRVKYCIQNAVKLRFTSIRQDLPCTYRTGLYPSESMILWGALEYETIKFRMLKKLEKSVYMFHLFKNLLKNFIFCHF